MTLAQQETVQKTIDSFGKKFAIPFLFSAWTQHLQGKDILDVAPEADALIQTLVVQHEADMGRITLIVLTAAAKLSKAAEVAAIQHGRLAGDTYKDFAKLVDAA